MSTQFQFYKTWPGQSLEEFKQANSCHWPMMHYPDDLYWWKSQRDEDGSLETLVYQDDGFGNLIRIKEYHRSLIRSFVHGTQNH